MNLAAAIVRLHHALASRARNLWFRALGVRMTGYVWMRRCSIPRNWSDVTLEAGASLDDHVTLLASGDAAPDKIVVGANTYLNRGIMLDAHESIRIGPDCMIGPLCYITDADHGTQAGTPVASQPMETAPVRIGAEVWLGAGVKVLKGVTIGDGAVIGAGAVVTHDIPAGAIAVGVPARVIGQRGAPPS
jgi:carbonic anhydrase/acetyltransferase-like protein (isoleucine patch superfamily)